jgi:hypothetical protein
VGDTYLALKLLFVYKLTEFGDSSGSAQSMQSTIQQRDSGGIITTIFEAVQAF